MSGLCSAQTDEPIKMAYERQTSVGLWDHVVNRVCTLAPPGNCDGTIHARGVCTACRLAGISLGYTSVIVTAHVVYAAESMQLTGVRPSVCLSRMPLLQVCCCGPGGQEISIDCCSCRGQWHVVSVPMSVSNNRFIQRTIAKPLMPCVR